MIAAAAAWNVVIGAIRIQLVTERLPAFLLGVAFGPLTAIVPMLMARGAGTLELLVSAPTRAWIPILGRVIATTAVSLFAVPETFLVAWLLGISIPVGDPFIFAVAMIAFSLSTVGAGMAMANFFVLTRSASLWANLFGFPFFILAAASFPITLLPGVIQPLSYLVAMYWTADLLRAASTAVPPDIVIRDLSATVGLAVGYIALALWLYEKVERRVRLDGSITSL